MFIDVFLRIFARFSKIPLKVVLFKPDTFWPLGVEETILRGQAAPVAKVSDKVNCLANLLGGWGGGELERKFNKNV